MLRKNRLTVAVSAAIGLSTMAVLPSVANAEEKLLEEVVVTGSRIARTDFDNGAQIVSMDRQEIDALGLPTVADVLRSSPLNSLGSFSERSGSSAQSNANIDLRGLGADRTLVMINGRRMTGSPNTGAAAININMIPMAAVERIDILADGGSAVYGSDAVAGVVNMMMRDNYDGLELRIGYGDRKEDDGEENQLSLIGGLSNDRGNITFAMEYSDRDAIFDRDREYTSAWARDTNGNGIIDAYVDTDGYSIFGKSVWLYDPTTGYDNIQAANGCEDTSPWLGVVDSTLDWFPSVEKSTYCMYGYANASANKASLEKINTYTSFHYDINEHLELYGTALFSRVESFGRYAPPAAYWNNMPEDYKDVPFDIDALLADGSITESLNPETGEMEPNYSLTGFYRWTNIGPRDNYVTDTQYDFVFGGRGDINDTMSYDVYAQKSHYDVEEFGYYYLSYPGLDYVMESGIDPFSEEGAGAMSATTTQDNFTDMVKYYGHMQFEMGDWFGGGNVFALAGVEYFEVEYQNLYDRASEAGFVGGSAGNSSNGDRDVLAVFGEAIIPVGDSIEVSAAVRYDDYSDFGDNISPSLSVSWNVLDSLSLRSRVSTGFRAPSLDQLYGPETFSAEDATDYYKCGLQNIAPGDCPSGQIDTYYSTNPDVDAETSTTFSFGGNWEFIENWSIDLNYWMVEVEDTISQSGTQSILYAEAAGVVMNPSDGTYVDRVGGRPTVYSTYSNAGDTNVEGLDIGFRGLLDTGIGTFTMGALWAHQLKYETSAYYKGAEQDLKGFYLMPEDKAQLVLGWNMGRHSVSYVLDFISSHAEANTIEVSDSGTAKLVSSSEELDSWTTQNIAYTFDGEGWGRIKIGARNFTNEDPVLDKSGKFDRDLYSLYDPTGAVYYAEYTIEF